MDIPISAEVRKRRRARRWLIAGATAVVLTVVTVALSRLQPAAPSVEKASLFMDTVKRGEMLCQVRGNGTLLPEDTRWIPTQNAGRVEHILVLPGARVKADTVLVELTNPDVDQAVFDTGWQLKGAEADMAKLRVQLKTDELTQRKEVATAEADYSNAKLDYDLETGLAKSGIAPQAILAQARTKADESSKLLDIERERLAALTDSAKAQMDAQDAKVSQLRAQLEMKRSQLAALEVRAGMDGVLQRLGDMNNPLQEGQQLAAGASVARVANVGKLKAAIKIAETQAKDLQMGQRAQIDTRNGIITGHVIRIDPSVENGTVTVDVALDPPLPKGARPDLSVDGTIEIARLDNVLYVGRPVQTDADSQVGLFKVIDAGHGAMRVAVKLGRGSVSSIEILSGLQAGDQIILSDMSQWDTHDHLRLN
ncbi:MAG: efflux RND transporter periplasmic adaptor subunit [Verrucomicrobiota bacterium]|jgi:HlyD family secretion protein